MQPLQPEQANFLLHGVYLPALKSEHRITKSTIEAIPPDKSDYRPDGISKGAFDLAWHITATEMRFMDAVLAGEFDLSPRPRPESIQKPEQLANWYEDQFQERFEKLTKMSNDELLKTVDFRGLFQFPAVRYLDFLMHHSIHHRGQLTMYLRPMGDKVPSIYGESHDSAEARKAAQQSPGS
jgi:uncharacterized damage-inducible protein DinB